MLNLDPTLLTAIASQAKAKAVQHPRWLTAIDRALVELESNPYLEWQDGHLLILSDSGTIYAANGVCQCKAYEFKNPCWHRACARIVRLYFEALAVQQAALAVVSRPRELMRQAYADGEAQGREFARRAFQQTAAESVADLFG